MSVEFRLQTVIDSSALIAILPDEPEAPELVKAIQDASIRRVSAASFLETANAIESRHKATGAQKLNNKKALQAAFVAGKAFVFVNRAFYAPAGQLFGAPAATQSLSSFT